MATRADDTSKPSTYEEWKEEMREDLRDTFFSDDGGGEDSPESVSLDDREALPDVQLTTEYDTDEYMVRGTREALEKQWRKDYEQRNSSVLYSLPRALVRAGETQDDYASAAFGDEDVAYTEPDDTYGGPDDAVRDDQYPEHGDADDGDRFVIDEFMTSNGTWKKTEDDEGREQYLKNGEPLVDYGEDEDTWKEQLAKARDAYNDAKSHRLPDGDD